MRRVLHLTELRNANGELDCENGPAVFNEDKTYTMYYRNGKLERKDGPAVTRPRSIDGKSSVIEYRRNGEYHRDEDEPSYIGDWYGHEDSYEHVYYKNGKQHRVGKPSRIIFDALDKVFYV